MIVSRIDFSALDFLLIEENNFVRELVGGMLRGFGVTRLREARSIEAAMTDIERHPPDIILCDWMMKPTDGLSFLRKLRADGAKPYAHALAIMINEHASSDHIEAALGEGADSYIVKPFRAATLLAHLVQVITGQQVHLVD
ncbi:MAG: response regulator [Pseudomonadota bacterium]